MKAVFRFKKNFILYTYAFFTDGLVDCADAECCTFEHCKQSPLCLTSHDPIDILLRKQPPAVTASFFQRTRFIVEEGSVQNYAEIPAFNSR